MVARSSRVTRSTGASVHKLFKAGIETPVPTDFETLLKEIANSPRIPDEALRAAMAHAAELQPRIEALARRRIEGLWLYPAEHNLLFYGLFVLAAGKAPNMWPVWFDLLDEPTGALEDMFGDGLCVSVASLTLAFVGDESDAVARLILDPDMPYLTRAGLVDALTRLMCEGRYPRADFIALIDALAALTGTDDDDGCKWSVENAIALGAIAERRDFLEQLWTTRAFAMCREIDRAEVSAILDAAMADAADLTRFDEALIAAPTDPVDALKWLKSIESFEPDPDGVALEWREREWLAALLQHETMPPDAMTFEEVDGLFHALVIGPDLVLPSEYLREIWGEGPEFEDLAQAQKALELLQRHWNAIAKRRAANSTPTMWLEEHAGFEPGRLWAAGFSAGVRMRRALWTPLLSRGGIGMALSDIMALDDAPLEPNERAEILGALADYVMEIAEYWSENAARGSRQPKVGRNAPCPCGSGKKWKKCCGAGPPPLN